MKKQLEPDQPSAPNTSVVPLPELDILYNAIDKLADAQTSHEVLDAVSDYPRSCGAVASTLGYIRMGGSGAPEWWEVAAEWGIGTPTPRGNRGVSSPLPPELMTSIPGEPLLITDATTSPDLHPTTRERCRKVNVYGMAFLPLHFRGHWLGFVTFKWNQPHVFEEQDQRLYTAFARQLSVVTQNEHDYHKLQAAQQALQNQASFLQNLIDRIPNPIFYKDAEGRYQGCNAAFLELYGKPREEVVGRSVFDLNPPELAPIYYARDQEVFSNPDDIQIYESPVRYADGSIRSVIYNKAALKNRDGSLWGLVGVITDITERRQAEEALRENEERLRLIMQNSQEGVLLMDMDANILMVNPAACAMFGCNEGDMLSHKIIDLVDSKDPRARRFIEEAMTTDHARGELTALHKVHAPFPVEVSVGLFMSRDGKQKLGSVTMHDLTNRHRLQQALIEEEKLRTALAKETELGELKSRMMVLIAHAFRTPLTIIHANAETLEAYSERLSPDQRTKRLKNIYAQVRDLSDFLSQIGMAMNGNLVPKYIYISPVDLTVLCHQITHQMEKQSDSPRSFIFDMPDSCTVQADLSSLSNAITQIIQNAVQFSAAPAPVKISIIPFEQSVELSVTDSGIGIPPIEQKRVFEAFYRGSRLGKINGLGLGLTIAKACIEKQHGSIQIDSVYGHGTTVRIRLPYAPPN